jgi:hypothetical protein
MDDPAMKAVLECVTQAYGPDGPSTSLPFEEVASFVKREFNKADQPDFRFDLLDWFTRWASKGSYENLYIPSVKLRFELLKDIPSCVVVAGVLALVPLNAPQMREWIDHAVNMARGEHRLIRYVLADRARLFARINDRAETIMSVSDLIDIGPNFTEDDIKLPVDLINPPVKTFLPDNVLYAYDNLLAIQHKKM